MKVHASKWNSFWIINDLGIIEFFLIIKVHTLIWILDHQRLRGYQWPSKVPRPTCFWKWVGEPGYIEPKVRLTLIPNTIPTELLEDNRTFSEETVRDEGVLCLSAATGEMIFIARDNMTEGWCDRTRKCRKGGFCVSIEFNFTANMSSAQVTRQGAT